MYSLFTHFSASTLKPAPMAQLVERRSHNEICEWLTPFIHDILHPKSGGLQFDPAWEHFFCSCEEPQEGVGQVQGIMSGFFCCLLWSLDTGV